MACIGGHHSQWQLQNYYTCFNIFILQVQVVIDFLLLGNLEVLGMFIHKERLFCFWNNGVKTL